jgi:serine/threonine protein kinase/tetratricopeptide (TPR) repeat protein
VYRARDTKLDRLVALKILPSEFADNEERRDRFVREAKAASALTHPNVAHIYEIGESDGVHFIAMEHVEGETLAARLKGRPLPTKEILDIGLQVADALDEAHEKGSTHRDIKPGNLIVTARKQVKVLDFGLAKIARLRQGYGEASADSNAPTEAKTAAGVVMGTVSYMSPEQALGRDVDGRSDLFSLGVVLYELTTGRLPFLGNSPTETINKITTAPPEAIARFNYEAPAEFERIIRKCLEKDPESRYQTAKELLVDLRNQKRDTESGAVAAGAPGASKRLRWPALAGGILVLVALVAGGVYWSSGPTTEQIDSMAVLPFENAGGDPDTEYFSDGVTESIISSLSQLPAVRVISRTSAFHYKSQVIDPQAIGRELDVEALVLGRIVQRGDEISISAELVRTSDSGQIWGERYQRKTSDVFGIQREMAKEISDALRLRLTTEQEERLTKQYTTSSKAYQAYLKGRYYWNQRTEEGLRQAIVHFREAIEADPGFALAYSGTADCYSILGWYYVPGEEVFPKARAAAESALDLDATLAHAHNSLAYVKLAYDWDLAEAERGFQRAIALNSAYETAHHWYSVLLAATDRHDEAIEQIRLAVELDPLSLIINDNYGLWLATAGRYEESEEQFRTTLELDPNWALGYLRLGMNYGLQGRHTEAVSPLEKAVELSGSRIALGELGHAYAKSGRVREARAVLERLEELERTTYISPLEFAAVYAGLGDLDAAFEWLDRAYEERTSQLIVLRVFTNG